MRRKKKESSSSLVVGSNAEPKLVICFEGKIICNLYIYVCVCCFQSHRELVFVELCAQAKEVDQEKTSVRWAFRFGPTQEGAEHLVPFIMSGTDMYIQELEKLANNSHELEEEEEVVAA